MWRQNSASGTNVFLLIGLTFFCSCHFGASLGRPPTEPSSKTVGLDSAPLTDIEKENSAGEKSLDDAKPQKVGIPPYGAVPRVATSKDASFPGKEVSFPDKDVSFPGTMTNDIHDGDQGPIEGPKQSWADKVVVGRSTGGTMKESAIDRATDGAAAKYMWDLYERFSTDKYSHPRGNTIRTFKSISTGRSSAFDQSWYVIGLHHIDARHFCDLRVSSSSELLHNQLWLLRLDFIPLSIMSGRNNMRYEYNMICFGICMRSL